LNDALKRHRADAGSGQRSPRLLGVLAAWRLQAYGYALAAAYAAMFFSMYKAGGWLVNSTGVPRLNDFTYNWIGGAQALHGNAALLYDPTALPRIQAAVVGLDYPKETLFQSWPYPPIFFLVMAPLAVLPYFTAFLGFQAVTLLGCIAVVFLIVRRPAAIALVLASPFNVMNAAQGQTGFLRASLVGAALLTLERRPVLAGVFIGCLTYKPQFGILFPVALIAARQWRAFASAAITAAFLAGVSIAAFGTRPWEALPRALLGHADGVLVRLPNSGPSIWPPVQTVHGLIRALHGSETLAALAQGCTTAGVAMIVWLVWRSPVRYPLKAAILSAATLIATPFAWAHDLTVIAIPVAFLASDQIGSGLLRGEQTIMIALLGAAGATLLFAGTLPLGPVIVIALVGVILRRVVRDGSEPGPAVTASRPPEASRGMALRASS
jgi:arabinofuranan 3-O-arabinosyltransferase